MKNLLLKVVLEGKEKLSGPFQRAGGASNSLQKSVRETAEKLRGLEAANRKLKSFSRLNERADKNAAALEEARQKAYLLGRAIAAADKATKGQNRTFETARKRVRRLKLQQEELRGKISGVRKELQTQGVSTGNLNEAQRRLNLRTKRAGEELQRYTGKLNKAQEQTRRLTRARNAFNRSMSQKANIGITGAAGIATGRAMLSGAASVVQPGIDFEEQMSRVGALARLEKSSAEFAKLNILAKELGKTTHFSASEAAQGMGFLAMAGFKTGDILETMPGMLNLAKAGALDLGQTADIASNILSGFGLEADQMNRVSDVLAGTFTRTNVDLAMLGDTMKYVAPIARTIGVSIEEASAMAGLLGNVGIQGAQAGTALRAIQSRLAAPPRMAQAALDKLNLSSRDAQGNMRSMIDVLAEMADKTKDMGSAVRLGFFKHIAGEEAGSAFAELVGKGGTNAIAKFTDLLHRIDGEAAQVANRMGDNAAGDLKEFTSAWEGMNIALTETNINPMREIIQSGTEIVRNTGAWIRENPKLAGTLSRIFAAVAIGVTALGGLALAVAGILGPFITLKFGLSVLGLKFGAFGGILASMAATGIPLVIGGIKAIGAALLANPIGLAITGMAAAALVLWKYWEPISGAFTSLWDAVSAAFDRGWDRIKSFAAKLKPVLSMLISTISAPLKMIDSFRDGISGFFGGGDQRKALAPARTIAAATIATAAVASPAVAGAATSVQHNSHKYEININVPPGADGREIAEAVRREMDVLRDEQAARNRSRLSD